MHSSEVGDVEKQGYQDQGSGLGGGVLEGTDLRDFNVTVRWSMNNEQRKCHCTIPFTLFIVHGLFDSYIYSSTKPSAAPSPATKNKNSLRCSAQPPPIRRRHGDR